MSTTPGTTAGLTCPSCEASSPPGTAACPSCDTPLPPAVQVSLPSVEVEAGGRIEGELLVLLPNPMTVAELRVFAFWWIGVPGKASTDERTVEVAEVVMEEGALPIESRHPFTLRLPPDPLSHAGEKRQVVWTLAGQVKLQSGEKLRDGQRLEVVPSAAPPEDAGALVSGYARRLGGSLQGFSSGEAAMALVRGFFMWSWVSFFVVSIGLGALLSAVAPQALESPVVTWALRIVPWLIGLLAPVARTWLTRDRFLEAEGAHLAFSLGQPFELELPLDLPGGQRWKLGWIEGGIEKKTVRGSSGAQRQDRWVSHFTVAAEGDIPSDRVLRITPPARGPSQVHTKTQRIFWVLKVERRVLGVPLPWRVGIVAKPWRG